MTKLIIIYVISERTLTRNHLLLKNKRGLRKDKGDPINVILMAISKLFNSINYTLLLREVSKYGVISGPCFPVFGQNMDFTQCTSS